jgi:hypothetical protein
MDAIKGIWLIGCQFTGSAFAIRTILSVRP